ncbi:hypothetical protein H5410_051399 [Solanum commersonii]|uniref:Uncharacterized protein n=1 Tax=Solanum commersonii TaxID=4109 RepID=A0A9J5X0F3_SOLCO|nr:hypothetical protein H5410_051399 [Solanum commersonii]
MLDTSDTYRSDGIVVGENISFVNLISVIATELHIDESKKNIVQEIQNFDATTGAICVLKVEKGTQRL